MGDGIGPVRPDVSKVEEGTRPQSPSTSSLSDRTNAVSKRVSESDRGSRDSAPSLLQGADGEPRVIGLPSSFRNVSGELKKTFQELRNNPALKSGSLQWWARHPVLRWILSFFSPTIAQYHATIKTNLENVQEAVKPIFEELQRSSDQPQDATLRDRLLRSLFDPSFEPSNLKILEESDLPSKVELTVESSLRSTLQPSSHQDQATQRLRSSPTSSSKTGREFSSISERSRLRSVGSSRRLEKIQMENSDRSSGTTSPILRFARGLADATIHNATATQVSRCNGKVPGFRLQFPPNLSLSDEAVKQQVDEHLEAIILSLEEELKESFYAEVDQINHQERTQIQPEMQCKPAQLKLGRESVTKTWANEPLNQFTAEQQREMKKQMKGLPPHSWKMAGIRPQYHEEALVIVAALDIKIKDSPSVYRVTYRQVLETPKSLESFREGMAIPAEGVEALEKSFETPATMEFKLIRG
jgi:hypothetical protein